MKDPLHITIDPEYPTVNAITQKVILTEKIEKPALLLPLLKKRNITRMLVVTDIASRGIDVDGDHPCHQVSSPPIAPMALAASTDCADSSDSTTIT